MSEPRLAHVIWQASKFLVSLLEKEYGLGKKVAQPERGGKDLETLDPARSPSARARSSAGY